MLKRSILMIMMQALSVSLGLFLTYYIAKTVSPAEYSIIAIYNVVLTLIATLSFIGFETEFSRNALIWQKETGNKVSNAIKNIFAFRLAAWLALIVPLAFYLFYISNKVYDGEHYYLFISFIFTALLYSFTNGIILILRGVDRFLTAMFIMFISNILVKLLSALVFYTSGSFEYYLKVLVFSPIFALLFGILYIKDYVNKSEFRLSHMFTRVSEVYKFGFSGYISYFKQNIDQIIMPLVLSSDNLGTYSLCKNIELVIKQSIENFFDPLTQKFVLLKCEVNDLLMSVSKLQVISYFILILPILALIGLSSPSLNVIDYIGLGKYEMINLYLCVAIFSQTLYLVVKVKFNYISLLYPAGTLLKYDLITIFLLIVPLFIYSLIHFSAPSGYEYLYRLYMSLVMLIITILVYKRYQFNAC